MATATSTQDMLQSRPTAQMYVERTLATMAARRRAEANDEGCKSWLGKPERNKTSKHTALAVFAAGAALAGDHDDHPQAVPMRIGDKALQSRMGFALTETVQVERSLDRLPTGLHTLAQCALDLARAACNAGRDRRRPAGRGGGRLRQSRAERPAAWHLGFCRQRRAGQPVRDRLRDSMPDLDIGRRQRARTAAQDMGRGSSAKRSAA